MNSAKQVKIGAILSYLSIALNIITGLIYTPWMISQIGKSQYGLYTLANSLITLFLIDFGLSSATSRYIYRIIGAVFLFRFYLRKIDAPRIGTIQSGIYYCGIVFRYQFSVRYV